MTKGSRQPAEVFKEYVTADNWVEVMELFDELCRSLCFDRTQRRPGDTREFFAHFKNGVTSRLASNLWKSLDVRLQHKEYLDGKACLGKKLLVIGAGPCGLRMALEGALLGATTTVIEMRNYVTRNNVLHLWPFVIHDIKALGAKMFYPKFCVGCITHISIRSLQLILLKICLIMGVEIHSPVTYLGLTEPTAGRGWGVRLKPAEHPLANEDFDFLVGADGKRNCLKGFTRKCLKPNLAIAVTMNFVNKKEKIDTRPPEIPGVSAVYKPAFFKEMSDHNIDLENLVYYRGDTHYFVMTPRKTCLLNRGIIKQDFPKDTQKLLAPENIDRQKLMAFARETASVATEDQLPYREFEVNHHGQEDIAIFDFTSIMFAKHSSLARSHQGKTILTCLVGDSLLEPFWPTGSGCGRGFLGVFDTAWLIRGWSLETATPLQLLATRENIYAGLKHSTPESLSQNFNNFTIDPHTRYGSTIDYKRLQPDQVRELYVEGGLEVEVSPPVNMPATIKPRAVGSKRKRSQMDPTSLLSWFQRKLEPYKHVVMVTDLCNSWLDGLAFAALLQTYRPHLIDVQMLNPEEIENNLALVFRVFEDEYGVSELLSSEQIARRGTADPLAMLSYLVCVKEALTSNAKIKRISSRQDSLTLDRKVSTESLPVHHGITMTLDRRRPYTPHSVSHMKTSSMDHSVSSVSPARFVAAMHRTKATRLVEEEEKKVTTDNISEDTTNEQPITELSSSSAPSHETSDIQSSQQQAVPSDESLGLQSSQQPAVPSDESLGLQSSQQSAVDERVPDTESTKEPEPKDVMMSSGDAYAMAEYGDTGRGISRTDSLMACHGVASGRIKIFEQVNKDEEEAKNRLSSPGKSPIRQHSPRAKPQQLHGDHRASVQTSPVKQPSIPKLAMDKDKAKIGHKQINMAEKHSPNKDRPQSWVTHNDSERSPILPSSRTSPHRPHPKSPGQGSPVKQLVPRKLPTDDQAWGDQEQRDLPPADPYMSLARKACIGKVSERMKNFEPKQKVSTRYSPHDSPSRHRGGDQLDSLLEEVPEEEKEDDVDALPTPGRAANFNDIRRQWSSGRIDEEPSHISQSVDSFDSFISPETNESCCICNKPLFLIEKRTAHGYNFHRSCCRCDTCHRRLGYNVALSSDVVDGQAPCKARSRIPRLATTHLFYDELMMEEARLTSLQQSDSFTADEDDDISDLLSEEGDMSDVRYQTLTSMLLLESHAVQESVEAMEAEGRELEREGLVVEKSLRSLDPAHKDGELVNNWLKVVQRKQEFVQKEKEIQLRMYKVEQRELQQKMAQLVTESKFMRSLGVEDELDKVKDEMSSVAEELNVVMEQIDCLQLTDSEDDDTEEEEGWEMVEG